MSPSETDGKHGAILTSDTKLIKSVDIARYGSLSKHAKMDFGCFGKYKIALSLRLMEVSCFL